MPQTSEPMHYKQKVSHKNVCIHRSIKASGRAWARKQRSRRRSMRSGVGVGREARGVGR